MIKMVRDLEDFQARAIGALEKWKTAQAKIAARDSLPAAGDIYVFSATAEIGVEWVIVLQHLDDTALWFMVPFDQNPMAGTWDVPVAESSEAGPGTLRCGRGIWIHVDDIGAGSRSGFLEQWYVDKARSRLAELVNPDHGPVKTRPEVDFDPDYQEWMDEVTAAAERLEFQLRAEPEVISIAGFNTAWLDKLPPRPNQAADRPRLVAESSGLASPADKEPSPQPGHVLAEQLPGTLVAIREGEAVSLLYFPAGTEVDPKVKFFADDTEKPVTWREMPDGAKNSAETFSTAQVELRLPDGTKKLLSHGIGQP